MKKIIIPAIVLCSLILVLGIVIFASSYSSDTILMYHLVLDKPYNNYDDLFVRPSEFESQLQIINSLQLETAFIDEIDKGKLILTFDDGYEDNYTNVYPLLKKYKIKATIFVIAAFIDTDGYLTSEQIKEMSDSGLVSIQSHSVSHRNLTELDSDTIFSEISESKLKIESITSKPVYALSYPYGAFNDKVKAAVKKLYTVAVTTKSPNIFNCSDAYSRPRCGVSRGITSRAFIQLLK